MLTRNEIEAVLKSREKIDIDVILRKLQKSGIPALFDFLEAGWTIKIVNAEEAANAYIKKLYLYHTKKQISLCFECEDTYDLCEILYKKVQFYKFEAPGDSVTIECT